MLLNFIARNARSFRDELELSMEATAIAEKAYIREIPWREGGRPAKVLPLACVFGANASGKSNLLKTMTDMRTHVLESLRNETPEGRIPRKSFLLTPRPNTEPTKYEISIVIGGVLHEYGFALNNERVLSEWAYRYPKGRAALIFKREEQDVRPGAADRSKTRIASLMSRQRILLLSAAGAIEHPSLAPIHRWFADNLSLATADLVPLERTITAHSLSDPNLSEGILGMLRCADIGIDSARIQKDPRLPDEETVVMSHSSDNGRSTELYPENESAGTQEWFRLAGPVLRALNRGTVLLADGLGRNLHPRLLRELVRLFQDPDTNPRNAQLLFNTHHVSLLGDTADDRLLGRDQIWFTEKSNEGATRLYPLSAYRPFKNEAIRDRYMRGQYGSVPILSPAEFGGAADRLVVNGS